MLRQSRRDLIYSSLCFGLFLSSVSALAQAETSDCSQELTGITLENNETPFFEHFHELHVPLTALQKPPLNGILLKTSAMDPGSYDVRGFKNFVQQFGLDPHSLSRHGHEVKISQRQLQRIANGEQNVEVRVVSANGNYVHNFLITASPAILASVRKAKV